MVQLLTWLVVLGFSVQAAVGLSYLISSVRENEKRASFFAAVQFAGMVGLLFLFVHWWQSGFIATAPGFVILGCFLLGGSAAAALLIKKSPANHKALQGTKGLIVGQVKRPDERDIVFARNRSLPPESDQSEAYYAMRPEYEAYDAARRKKGGPLGQPGSIDRPHDRPNVAATLASLSIPMHLSTPEQYKPCAHPEFREQRIDLSPEQASSRIKGYTLNLGADLVGIAEINPLWMYAKRGEVFHKNWEDWGKEIETNHRFAVVFATEMDFELVGAAPHTPTTIASMGNYAKGAFIATQLAAYIANLGHSATANHLRHYDGVLVPLAVDAGLGEVGRLGYLMTRDYGPRARLGAVTTDLMLVPDKPIDIGAVDFCNICKKCANCCPSNSIPLDDQKVVNGTLRWKLNAETCFDYWGTIGTDCNICMRVCPWSHASGFAHKIIRALITRNRLSRRLFNLMDDIFYGKKPKPRPTPDWAQYD